MRRVIYAASVVFAAACAEPAQAPKSRDAGITEPGDAASEAADPNPPCRACIAAPNQPGPGCADELSRCNDWASCLDIYACGYAAGCIFKKTQAESLECFRPCAEPYASIDDPTIVVTIQLISCVYAKCNDVCAVSPSR